MPPPDPDHGAPEPDQHWIRSVGWVTLGGSVGTAARALISQAVPKVAGVPFGILMINLTGAFLLGLLLELLTRHGPDTGRRRTIRLLGGTGILGGFTTYSALAVDTASLIDGGDPLRGAGYAMITVIVGVLLAAAGVALGRVVPITRRPSREAR